MSEDCVYKVLLLGDTTVGKTCFLMKYTDKTFQDVHISTIGLDYRLKSMVLKNGKNIKLQIWDTAGQDRFRAITKNYYKGANGIILIYDVTNPKTYDNVKNWVTQIREEASPNVVVYLCGNKIDMEEERKVKTEEGKKLADEFGLPFYETSAKNDININETFEDLVEGINTNVKNEGNEKKNKSKWEKYKDNKKNIRREKKKEERKRRK